MAELWRSAPLAGGEDWRSAPLVDAGRFDQATDPTAAPSEPMAALPGGSTLQTFLDAAQRHDYLANLQSDLETRAAARRVRDETAGPYDYAQVALKTGQRIVGGTVDFLAHAPAFVAGVPKAATEAAARVGTTADEATRKVRIGGDVQGFDIDVPEQGTTGAAVGDVIQALLIASGFTKPVKGGARSLDGKLPEAEPLFPQPDSSVAKPEDIFSRQPAPIAPLKPVDTVVLLGRKHHQVNEAIVKAVPVDVVDVLAAHGFRPEQLLSEPDVIAHTLPPDARTTVAAGLKSAAEEVGASARAALDRVLSSETAGGKEEILPALRAHDLNADEVYRLFTPVSAADGGLPVRPSGEGATRGGTEAPIATGDYAGKGGEAGSADLARLLNRHEELVTGAPRGSITKFDEEARKGFTLFANKGSEEGRALAIAAAGKNDIIRFPLEKTAAELAYKRKNIDVPEADRSGNPMFERTVIRGPKGDPSRPDFVVGRIKPKDWQTRTEALLNPEEIAKAAKWYSEIKEVFLKYTKGDEPLAEKYLKAWLVASQSIDVSGALNDVLLQAEQFARNIPLEDMKRGNRVATATQAARDVLQGEPITRGVGRKITDFVDSQVGKPVRAWMGNDPLGGKPFVVDVHTGRDTGLVDQALKNHLARLGYNADDLAKLDRADYGKGGVPDHKYENRAKFGNELTDYLNKVKWQGRDNWQPHEVQAVGWMGMMKLFGGGGEDAVFALERNQRRVSFELTPGDGSPMAMRLGDRYEALPLDQKYDLTKRATEKMMETAKGISGIDPVKMVHGSGGWAQDGIVHTSPAAVSEGLATRQGAETAANVLGLLGQQTEVWVNSIKDATASPKAFAVDFIEKGSKNLSTNQGVAAFWKMIKDADPTGLFGGFQPITTANGEVGIRAIIDKGGAKRLESIEQALKGSIGDATEGLGYQIEAKSYEADLTKARNDWKTDKNGTAYIQRLSELGEGRPPAYWDNLRQEFEDWVAGELDQLSSAEPRKTEIYRRRGSPPDSGGPPPTVRRDGLVQLTHYSEKELGVIDPAFRGTNPTIRGAERQRLSRPEMSYYGLDVGKPGGYARETGLGKVEHTAIIEPGALYNWDADVLGLKARADVEAPKNPFTRAEQLVREAGFAGYWTAHPELGRVAAVFEPLQAVSAVRHVPTEMVNEWQKAPLDGSTWRTAPRVD